MKLIFVCTSNVCRSPVAEALAIKWLKDHERDIEVISRSLSTDYEPENSPASKYSIDILLDEFGIDITSHRSKLLTENDINEDTIVIGITQNHQYFIRNRFPSCNFEY